MVRKAGARVRPNVFIRNLNIAGIRPIDSKRIKFIAERLALRHGAQFVIDTIKVCALRGDNVPHRTSATEDGVAFLNAAQTL